MTNKQFFNNLLTETENIFKSAPVKKTQDDRKEKWNYSICETPFQKGKGLIFGLNWGGGNHDPQTEYPKEDEERDWTFIRNGMHYFEEYLNVQNINEVNYSNLCFFRSPNIKSLTWADFELSLPLFKKYVEYIDPEWAVMLGTSGVPVLDHFKYFKDLQCIEVKGEKKKALGYKGVLFDKCPLHCVPHPQARISSKVRAELWQQLFSTGA